eukprot:TRINITY_DN4259_c0_g1_i13.p2 TRINITY_DN4259_c0_g1~~TRINITY_DN4259_c0_g1_i13.p2  ORF type:complete len:135 (+),score=6.74 TRINITY_DN4259_c0_g1_i13:49-405(+)
MCIRDSSSNYKHRMRMIIRRLILKALYALMNCNNNMKSTSEILLPSTAATEKNSPSLGSIVITGRLCTDKSSYSGSYQREESTPKVMNRWNLNLNLSSAVISPKSPDNAPGYSNEVQA